MSYPTCPRPGRDGKACDRPIPDNGYACTLHGVTVPEGQLATIADMTGAARDVAHGLARRSHGGAAGKPGSAIPLDLSATARLDAVQSTLLTWARHIASTRGVSLP